MFPTTLRRWRHPDGSSLVYQADKSVRLRTGAVGKYETIARGVSQAWAENYARTLTGFVQVGCFVPTKNVA